MSSEEELCALDIEIQSLKAIFAAEELEVERDEENGGAVKSLVVQMSPELSKGENVQFVRFEVVFNIPTEYPQTVPNIELRNVRGLSEETQSRTKEHMMKRADELVGNSMLFELIQVAKEQLMSSDTPSIPCSICLFSFHAEDSFSRTPCFHYFHTHCLAKHVQHTLEQDHKDQDNATSQDEKESQGVFCPVCRLPIPFSESDPEKFPAPKESLVDDQREFVLTPELKEMQDKMAALYSQQQAKGSIIDLEAEKNKFFIEISNTPDIQVLPAANPSSNKKRHDGASSKQSPEHIQKYFDRTNLRKFASPQSRNSDKTPVKDQRKSKPDISPVSDWTQDVDQPTETNLKEGSKNATEGEGWDVEGSASVGSRQPANQRSDGEPWRQRNDYSGDKWIRKRKPFDRKPRPRKDASNDYADGTKDDTDKRDSKVENAEDESVTQEQSEARMYKKRNFRKPRNPDSGKNMAEGSTGEAGDAESPDHKAGDEATLVKPENKENVPRNRPRYQKPQYRNRENDDNDFDHQQRYRKQNNKYNRPWNKKYNRDRQENSESQNEKEVNEPDSKVDGEDTSGGHVAEPDVDEQNQESHMRDGGYRNSRNWYKNKVPGKRGNYRKNENWGRNNTEVGEGGENLENVEERRPNPRRQFRGGHYKGPRDRFVQHDLQANVTSKPEDVVVEDAAQNVESDSELKSQSNENKKIGYAKNNRRFQKSSSRDSETVEEDKDTDRPPRDYNNRFGRNWNQPYKNKQNFRRSEPGAAPQNNESSVVPESNTEDNNNNVSNTHYDRDTAKGWHRRNPKYRNDSSNFSKEQGDQSETRDGEKQDEVASSRNVSRYNDHRGADFQEDNAGRKPWSDSRTNWKENRYSRYGYNRYQKPHGQQLDREKCSEMLDGVTTKKAATGTKNEQSSVKQHIQPFTHLSHNFVTDAQPSVSIPPPFSKSSLN